MCLSAFVRADWSDAVTKARNGPSSWGITAGGLQARVSVLERVGTTQHADMPTGAWQ
jgi:hypothetical protein